ncbi:MAG: Ppx/GppA family phosphatase, partial [Alphaproteobacteria bacterium]|nr:Ppx/GppA family phosphatase [Alphaproteobacteria bacterium]
MNQTRRQPKERGTGRRGPLLAALDLGTNNCRLLIAAPGHDGNLRIVDSFSRIVRLGEGTSRTGVLSEAAMERTVAALKICAGRLGKHQVHHVRAVATEACRRAANADVLIGRVARETGIRLSVVTAAEEARLAAIGCAPLIGRNYEGALAFDIGGGSTEVIWLRRGSGASSLRQFASIPLGVMSLAEADGLSSFADMRQMMLARFAGVRREMDKTAAFEIASHHLLGTSGTVTTLAGVAMNLPHYIRSQVDASWHDCADILKVVDRLAGLDRAERAALGCVGDERADL